MRVLVTGAAGFIGSHVTRSLLADGYEVVGLDDLSTGYRRNLPRGPRWSFVQGDIRNPEACRASLAGVERVVHLAGRNSVPRSLADPRSALDVNVMGGMTLLEAARAEGVSRILYASSSSVYGDGETLPKREDQPRQPLSPYAASKAAFEHVAHAWSRSWGLPTLGLRFFNVFGPRQDANSLYAAVVPRFVEAALAGQRPLIHGDGSTTRDFTYVDNVVLGVRLALEAPTAPSGSVLNLACGGRVSVLELWRAVARATHARVEPRFGPVRPGDMPHTEADISAAMQQLGYAPEISFDEGIQRTVAWYASQQAGEAA